MQTALNRWFRRKSVSEQKLKEDYPTCSEESDITDDERRRYEWNRYLNEQTLSDDVAINATENAARQWDYESEYDYSVASSSSIAGEADARRLSDPTKAKMPLNQHIDRNIDERIREQTTERMQKPGRRPSALQDPRLNDRVFNWNTTLSPVRERVKDFEHRERPEQIVSKKRKSIVAHLASLEHHKQMRVDHIQYDRDIPDAKKQRKRANRRRRARDISSSEASDDEKAKYTVNISLDQLDNIIKKNITSAVKTIVTATEKKHQHRTTDDSCSTETETIFSGSSGLSADIPAVLLKKQIKAQLDRDNLKGIIKQAVAIEANEHRRQSLRPPASIPAITNQPPSPHPGQRTTGFDALSTSVFGSRYDGHPAHELNVSHQYAMHSAQCSPYLGRTPEPPAPPPPPPVSHVNFNFPALNHAHTNGTNTDFQTMLQMRRASLMARTDNNTPNVNPNLLSLFGEDNRLYPNTANFSRLQNRRHTLAATTILDADYDESDKLEQFSNALKRLDKTLKRDEKLTSESSSSLTSENEVEHKKKKRKETAVKKRSSNSSECGSDNSEIEQIATKNTAEPNQSVSSLAPILSIADQIAALSKKKKEPLDPANYALGQLIMSDCARTFLVISNLIFLIVGAGVGGLGVWMMMDPNIEQYFTILNVRKDSGSFKLVCYAVLAIGVLAFIIAFMGFCGVIRRSKCLLTVFLVTVLSTTLLHAGLMGVVMMSKDSTAAMPALAAIVDEVSANLRNRLKETLVQEYLPETMVGTIWDKVQIQLQCCGATGPDDYKISRWNNDTRPETDFPDTCCKLVDVNAPDPEPTNKLLCHFGTAGFFYDVGCFEKMIAWFDNKSVYIVAATGAVLFVEVVAFVSSCMICRKSEKKGKAMQARTAQTTHKQTLQKT